MSASGELAHGESVRRRRAAVECARTDGAGGRRRLAGVRPVLAAVLVVLLLVATVFRYRTMAWPFTYRLVAALPALPVTTAAAVQAAGDERLALALRRFEASPLSAETNGELAAHLHAWGLLDEAAVCYRRAARLDRQPFAWEYLLGRCLLQAGKTGEAGACLAAALPRAAGYLPAYVALAEVRLACGDAEAARRVLDEALRIDPRCAVAAWMRGRAAQQSADAAEARRWFAHALRLEPDFAEARYALSLALRADSSGAAQQELRRVRGAQPRAGVVDPLLEWVFSLREDGGALAAVGARHARAGRHAQAADAFRRALERAPDRAQVRYRLARELQALGRLEEAVEQLRRVVAAVPDHAGAHAALAEALDGLNRPAEAAAARRAAWSLDAHAAATDESRAARRETHR